MEIKSGRIRLTIENESSFIVFILRRDDMIVHGTVHENWIVSSLKLATPIFFSPQIVGHIKNWMYLFGFQDADRLDSALMDFMRNLPRTVPPLALPEPVKPENKPN